LKVCSQDLPVKKKFEISNGKNGPEFQ